MGTGGQGLQGKEVVERGGQGLQGKEGVERGGQGLQGKEGVERGGQGLQGTIYYDLPWPSPQLLSLAASMMLAGC